MFLAYLKEVDLVPGEPELRLSGFASPSSESDHHQRERGEEHENEQRR